MNCFVFDIDGTLIDTEYGHIEGLRRALLEKCGKDYHYDELRRFFGMPGEDTIEILGIDNPNDFIKHWYEVAAELNKGKMCMFNGMRQVLDTLKQKNIPMGIVTSQDAEELKETYKNFDLGKYFEIAIHMDLTERHKPYPDPLNKFFELTELSKDGALYVGDTKNDWKCAKAAGVKFCLAGWGCGNPEGIMPDYYLRTPITLLQFVRE